MTKPIDEKLALILRRNSDPARYTGKSVAWHVARNERLRAKFYSAKRRLALFPVGSPNRAAIRARMKRLSDAGISARRDAAAQYRWDQRQRDKACNLGARYSFGPSNFAAMAAKFSDVKYQSQREWFERNFAQPYQRALYESLIGGGFVEPRKVGFLPELGMGYGSCWRGEADIPLKNPFETTGPATGRMSSKAPSADNLPRYTYPVRCKINFSNQKKENNTMKIEVGKKYNTRDGRVAEVVFENRNPSQVTQKFILSVSCKHDSSATETFTVSAGGCGSLYADMNYDLVSEHVPFKLKVGGIYVTRDGLGRYLVTAKESNGAFATLNLATRRHVNHARTETGHCYESSTPHPYDLVKLCPNVKAAERAAAEMYRLADGLLRNPTKWIDGRVEVIGGSDGVSTQEFSTCDFTLKVRK